MFQLSLRASAALVAACITAAAQVPAVDIPYQKFVLPNGLTLLVHEDHKAPVVAVNVWYHVGSKNEKPGKTGFAHLFEHLMFGGSENVKMRYVDAMERAGATDLNGTTNQDRTNYFETVPVSSVDYTLFLESDRMGHLLKSFDKKTLDLQRGVVQNEKRQGENQPYGLAEERLEEATFPSGHPYSWSVIGSMQDLNGASMEDVSNWFKTYYGPSNAVLVLAGDIDPATAKAKVEKYFGDIPPGPPVGREQIWIAKMRGSRREVMQDRVPQARVYKAWNVPQYGSADADYLSLAASCLTQGKTSRLYKRLVYDEQIATDVHASVEEHEIASQFIIEATAKPGQDLAKVESAINDELAKFIAEGPSAAELDRVKTERLAAFIRGLQRVGGFGGKSDVLAAGQIYTGDPAAYKRTLQRVSGATPAEVRSAAKTWLADGVFALEVHPFPDYKAAQAGVDRAHLPELGNPPAAHFPKLERAKLSNGMNVILVERHDLPLVNFWMSFDAGYASDQFAKPGTATLAMTVLTSGTKTRNALEISDEARRLGAQLNARSNLDRSTVSLAALKSKLGPSLDLFSDVILNPVFPESDFQREKRQQLARIGQEEAQPVAVALRTFPALIYGKGHAYGNPLTGSGTTASVQAITRDALVKFHDTWFHPNNATLIVAGDTTLAEIMPLLESHFASWKPAEVPKKNLARVQLPAKPAVYLIDRPGALQSIIIAGQVAPPRNNPQEIALGVMNDIVGGTFGSRLNMNLREEKHWSYGAFSIMVPAEAQSPFITIAPVQTDKTKESLAEMDRELHEIASTRPVTAEEFDRDQARRLLSLPGSHETLQAVGGSVQQIVAYGFPDNYFDTYPAKLRALTVAQVDDATKSVLHPDNLVWVVIGDRAKIEPGVRALNIGEVHLLDANGNPL